MSRAVYYFESQSPDKTLSLNQWAGDHLSKIKESQGRQGSEHWAVYCNDRLVPDWNKKIRAQSKMVWAARYAEPVGLTIVYDRKEIIILDKPSGLPTQKTLKDFEDNLYDRVKLHFIQKKCFPLGLPYIGLHHRLDRGTSGLVLMTKQRQANKEVADLFKNRKIEKHYLAYVEWGEGVLPKRWRQVDWIRRGKASKNKFFFEVANKGDEAITDFIVEKQSRGKNYLLRCLPKTGRTHQLRVQLAHKGHAILGDNVYGQKASAPRLMLHAQKLKFKAFGNEIDIQSTTPFQWEGD